MSDSILYNQEVTSEILNDIAIDLGNTSFNGFGEEKFGADELNNITASLVSKGVLLSQDKCKPILNGNNVDIQTGIIVFENGAKKKLTETVSVPLVLGSYIYALNKTSSGTCEIIVSSNNPKTDETVMLQDYVPIAQINSDGVLIDKRIFSTVKASIPAGNEPITETVKIRLSNYGTTMREEFVASYDFGRVLRVASIYDEDGVQQFTEIFQGPHVGNENKAKNAYYANHRYLRFYIEETRVDVYAALYDSSFDDTINITFI